MEKICPHCNEIFVVKRIDSIYCSRSCRQMAYINRKSRQELPLPILPSLEVSALSEAEITHLVSGDNNAETNVAPLNEVPCKNLDVSNCLYVPSESNFLNALIELTNDRHHLPSLRTCLIHEDLPSYSVSLHLRCLIECLLVFSEMKVVATTDLMELCDAFTYTIRSKSYSLLPDEYPYKETILILKEKLKRVCVKAQEVEKLKFSLTIEDKMELIAMRFELSQFIPKRQFIQLDFENA